MLLEIGFFACAMQTPDCLSCFVFFLLELTKISLASPRLHLHAMGSSDNQCRGTTCNYSTMMPGAAPVFHRTEYRPVLLNDHANEAAQVLYRPIQRQLLAMMTQLFKRGVIISLAFECYFLSSCVHVLLTLSSARLAVAGG